MLGVITPNGERKIYLGVSNSKQNEREGTDVDRTDTDGLGLDRRSFLSMTGVATATMGGWFSGSAAAAEGNDTLPGYGTAGYGEAAYGGVQETTS